MTKNANSLKILFITKTPEYLGTRRLFFDHLSRDFSKFGINSTVSEELPNSYFDVFITKSDDFITNSLKKKNPNAVIGIVHPSDYTKGLLSETKNSDFIIAGSLEEKDYYLKYIKNIFILPHIEDDWGKCKVHFPKDEIVIGYHGNKQHLEHFDFNVGNALSLLSKKYKIRLKAIYDINNLGKWEKGCPDINVQHIQWNFKTLADNLLECDIGIVPSLTPISSKRRARKLLQDKSYNGFHNDYLLRFKNCSNAGRVFVFVQLGIPVVAGMTPENCQFILHGQKGYIAHSTDGWYYSLEEMICSLDKRKSIAKAALNAFYQDYDRNIYIKDLLEFISRIWKKKRH